MASDARWTIWIWRSTRRAVRDPGAQRRGQDDAVPAAVDIDPHPAGFDPYFGTRVDRQPAAVRLRLGVVFQAPSLDRKLTVRENLHYQGPLYGLGGRELRERAAQMLERLGLADRQHDLVETLSGGLRRRVELAKGLLHRPPLLLLDEPSTGLEPGARSDLWNYLRQIRDEDGVTVVLTTHLLEEADRVDRLAILNQGRLVALDTPDNLRATVGGDSITIDSPEPAVLAGEVEARFGCPAKVVEGRVRLEQPQGHQLIARLVEAFPGRVQSITLGKPSLEDVFIDRTGHRFWSQRLSGEAELAARKKGRR